VLVAVLLVACGDKPAPSKLLGWLDDWERARQCLVGTHGIGEDTATATAIAELIDGPCERDAGLRYPGLPDDRGGVAARWEVATERIDQIGRSPTERGPAIDAIDLQVVAMRSELRLAAIRRTRGAPIETLPADRHLLAGGWAVASSKSFDASAFTLGAVRLETERGHVLATSLDEVRVIGAGGVPAWPTMTWRADALRDEGAIAIGPEGGPIRKVPVGGDIYVIGAIDAGTTRLVLVETLGEDSPYSVVVSTDGGARWRVVEAPAGVDLAGVFQDPRTGGVDLLARTSGYLFRHAWHPGSAWWNAVTSPGAVVFPEAPRGAYDRVEAPRLDCTNAGVAWGVRGLEVLRVDDDGFAFLELRDQATGFGVDCRGDTLLVMQSHPDRVELCHRVGCQPVHEAKHDRDGAAALLDDGRWIYAAVLDGVAGVWRDGAAPAFYRLASPGELRAITVLRGVPHLVLGATGEPYRFVALP
jgi:hypothetical protein